MRILVIDDEKAVRGLFAEALSRAGHEVDTAEGGPEGLQLLQSTPYEVVFVDILLPGGMSGFDVFDEIRQRGTSSRVVLMTGRPMDEKLASYADRADGLLRKPINGLHQIVAALEA